MPGGTGRAPRAGGATGRSGGASASRGGAWGDKSQRSDGRGGGGRPDRTSGRGDWSARKAGGERRGGAGADPRGGGGPRRDDRTGAPRGQPPGRDDRGRRAQDGGGAGRPDRTDRTGRPARASERAAPAGGRRGAPASERDRSGRPPRPGTRIPIGKSGTAGAARKGWGSLARKGTRLLDDAPPGTALQGKRDAPRAGGADREPWQPEVWVREDEAPAEHLRSPKPGSVKAEPEQARRHVVKPVAEELAKHVDPSRMARTEQRLAEAVKAYERERYRDALRLLKPLAEASPGSASIRELYGLSLYRLGRWAEAVRELEAFNALGDSYDQHPVLMDCYRALKRWPALEETWEDLRQTSPSSSLVTEGRIVAAGAAADRGDLRGAIALLEKGRTSVRNPQDHHLRLWYALADLYDRAGEVPRARELFQRIAEHDAAFFDVRQRLRSL